jgi:integrase
MLRWAASPGEKKIDSNPLAHFKPLPHDHPKEGRAFSDEEVDRFLTRSPQPWRDIWYAYLVTGLRKRELIDLLFTDIDWDNREIIVRSSRAKNHRERRIPIENGLWEILCRQHAQRGSRQPGSGPTPAITKLVQSRFTRDHVFVSTQNTPLSNHSRLWRAFRSCCKRAGIPIQTRDAEGWVIEHLDVHSLRRTFATNLITSGADPETVRQLLGHQTLEMTMKIYTKIRNQTKRQALTKLTYGHGAAVPDHVVEFPEKDGFAVQNGHEMVTSPKEQTGT